MPVCLILRGTIYRAGQGNQRLINGHRNNEKDNENVGHEKERSMSDCPLVTPYTIASGISSEMLEKLFIVRHWDFETRGEIPFNRPPLLRKTIWNIAKQCDTQEPFDLRQYQIQMATHLTRMPRFICGDAVGLGKTIDVIVASAWLKDRFPDSKVVVITTKSTTWQWAEEIERFSYLRPYVMRDSYRGHTSSDARYSQMMQFLEGKKKDVM